MGRAIGDLTRRKCVYIEGMQGDQCVNTRRTLMHVSDEDRWQETITRGGQVSKYHNSWAQAGAGWLTWQTLSQGSYPSALADVA